MRLTSHFRSWEGFPCMLSKWRRKNRIAIKSSTLSLGRCLPMMTSGTCTTQTLTAISFYSLRPWRLPILARVTSLVFIHALGGLSIDLMLTRCWRSSTISSKPQLVVMIRSQTPELQLLLTPSVLSCKNNAIATLQHPTLSCLKPYNTSAKELSNSSLLCQKETLLLHSRMSSVWVASKAKILCPTKGHSNKLFAQT